MAEPTEMDDSQRMSCSGNHVFLDGAIIAIASDHFVAQCIVDALENSGLTPDKIPAEAHDRLRQLFD